jgi:protein phosphatase
MKLLKLSIQLHSVAGVKDENQDACAYHIPTAQLLEHKGITTVIADGVSACERAKEASNSCVNGFLSDYYSTPDSWSTEHSANKVISALNNWLYSQSARTDKVSSMLSTLSVLVFKSNIAHLFHVGDSRIYQYRDGVLMQLTKDHVMGINSKETFLSRAVGFDLHVYVDYRTINLQLGDRFLMTTDGVHNYLNHASLERLMSKQATADGLVDVAIASGSDDNLSALICEVEQLPEKNLDEAFDELVQKPIPPDLESGMKINNFEVESLLHCNSRTQIYLATDIQTKQQVILKTPSVNYEDDPAYLKRFVYEQWAGQRIHSPYVVKIHSSGEDAQFLAYAMEYVKGETLRQWIESNPNPSLGAVIRIVKQIIKGLRAFHRQEMLHCDLKPENIIISTIGEVKIIDFGSTRIAGVAELSSPILSLNNQGTQGYTAPEVILDDEVSQESDRFSLAVIVYEMLSGHLPYQNKLNKHLNKKKLSKVCYQSLLEHNAHIPIWVDGAIRRACHLSKENRYETLSEFLYDLEHPNSQFLKVAQVKKPGFVLKKYRLLIALSFALNIFMLLMLVS